MYVIVYDSNGMGEVAGAQRHEEQVPAGRNAIPQLAVTPAPAIRNAHVVTLSLEGGVLPDGAEPHIEIGESSFAEFASWNVEKDGSGTAYQAGDEIDVNANLVLYAQWNNQTQPLATVLPTPTREGYAFAGWYDMREGGQRIEEGSDALHGFEGDTLYARWMPLATPQAPAVSPQTPQAPTSTPQAARQAQGTPEKKNVLVQTGEAMTSVIVVMLICLGSLIVTFVARRRSVSDKTD